MRRRGEVQPTGTTAATGREGLGGKVEGCSHGGQRSLSGRGGGGGGEV